VVLVHPQGHGWYPGRTDVSRVANIMPPHGLMMLAAVLERAGYAATILDLFAHPLTDAEAVARILADKPDAVGFSTTTAGFPSAYRLAEGLKAVRPDLPVLFGGVHATSIWRTLLERFPALDTIVVGEGEQAIVELAEAGFRPSSDIKGLAFRDAGGVPTYSGGRPLLRDLDSLPYPAYEKLVGFPKSYPMPIFNYPRSPATTFITSRGCPYSCSYCDRSVFGSSFRFHSAEHLVDHLAFLKERYGIRHVGIYDDNFTLRRERVVAFAELLLKRGLKTTFNCIARTNHLDRDMLRLLKRAGCWMMNVGVESGDEVLLRQHRKHCEQDEVTDAIRMIRESGIRVKGLFMLGIPGETEETIEATASFIVRNRFDDINVTKFTPFPGSPIYAKIREFGEFDEDWGQMNCANWVFVPKGFTRPQLERHYIRLYRMHYSRPGSVWNFVSMAWKSPESLRRFFAALPQFLEAERGMRDLARGDASGH
jgi:radical SAM superfamily enzyme YgiQ (UPF0313 family)